MLEGWGQVASALSEGGLLVVVLCGHGFQAIHQNGRSEPDALDEVFAASDGPVLDYQFGHVWESMKASTDLVVIVDTCSADTLRLRGGRDVEPVDLYRTAGPARLRISASMAREKAGEVTTRHGARGQLSLALEDAWLDPDARSLPPSPVPRRGGPPGRAPATAAPSPALPRARRQSDDAAALHLTVVRRYARDALCGLPLPRSGSVGPAGGRSNAAARQRASATSRGPCAAWGSGGQPFGNGRKGVRSPRRPVLT